MATPDQSPPTSSFEHLLAEQSQNTQSMRLGILAAVLVHVVIFALTWPTLASPDREEKPKEHRYFVVPHTNFQPPERRTMDLPQLPSRRVPIPDATPDGPEEPMESSVPIEVPDIPDVVYEFVTPPPPPETNPEPPPVVQVLHPPKTVHRVMPRYTETAQRAHYQGDVVLNMVIDTEGRVLEVTVLSGLPLGLNESAVEAASQWIFEPCTFGGRPVKASFALTVKFRLQ